jgi:hypothetical protein
MYMVRHRRGADPERQGDISVGLAVGVHEDHRRTLRRSELLQGGQQIEEIGLVGSEGALGKQGDRYLSALPPVMGTSPRLSNSIEETSRVGGQAHLIAVGPGPGLGLGSGLEANVRAVSPRRRRAARDEAERRPLR